MTRPPLIAVPAYLVEPGRVDGFGNDRDLRAAALGRNEARLNEIRRSHDPSGLFDTAASLP